MLVSGIKCSGLAVIAAAMITSSASAEAQSAQEFPVETAALIAATTDFFDRVEAETPREKSAPVNGAIAGATKISAGGAPESTPLTRQGPVDHLTAYRITWYPVDRLLGSVDFMGTWDDNRSLVCGYLTWDLSDPDSPRLDQLSASFVDLSPLGTASEQVIHETLLEANCAHGAIDANFHVFDVAG